MIDFAHVFPAEDDSIDKNYLFGIENLVKILEGFLLECDQWNEKMNRTLNNVIPNSQSDVGFRSSIDNYTYNMSVYWKSTVIGWNINDK